MALTLNNTLEVIEFMENYVERVRPPEDIRYKLDISYRIDNQSIILYEIRPSFVNAGQMMESDFAKTTYVRKEDNWKVFWMRASGKWEPYPPEPYVKTLKEFTDLVDEDKHHCFKG